MAKAATTVEATYHSQYLHHAQLEPPSTLARFNDDNSLDIWLPNQGPEAVPVVDLRLQGSFPRFWAGSWPSFLYPSANPYPQATLAKKVGRPIKLIWSREEEFLRDPLRPMAAAFPRRP